MRYDSHHLLWTRKNWNKGYAHRLRKIFVYQLPMPLHQKLHEAVEPIPVLDEQEARMLYVEYKRLDHELDLEEALQWLILHAPNSEFAMAMMAQLGFIQNHEALYRD